MLQTSINEFIEDNPTATMEDLTMHFSDYTSLNDIELYNTDSKILEEKLKASNPQIEVSLDSQKINLCCKKDN